MQKTRLRIISLSLSHAVEVTDEGVVATSVGKTESPVVFTILNFTLGTDLSQFLQRPRRNEIVHGLVIVVTDSYWVRLKSLFYDSLGVPQMSFPSFYFPLGPRVFGMLLEPHIPEVHLLFLRFGFSHLLQMPSSECPRGR